MRARQQVGAFPAKFSPNHLKIPTKVFNAPQAVPSCVSSVFPAAWRPGRCRVWPCDRLADRQLFLQLYVVRVWKVISSLQTVCNRLITIG